MTALEIVLLILGAGVFVASFVIPENKKEEEILDTKVAKEEIQKLVQEEMENVQKQVSGVIDETVSYSVEKSERALERLTNEKMQAISEYSGTVLEDIHKNHEESMFMYDMLISKQENLKETASEVNNAVTKANEAASEVNMAVKEAEVTVTEMNEAANEVKKSKKSRNSGRRKSQADLSGDPDEQQLEELLDIVLKQEMEADTDNQFTPMDFDQFDKITPPEMIQADTATSITFDATDMGGNNNEMILKLHEKGKSNVAIAKELGLGVGEVKLVIDLFKGN